MNKRCSKCNKVYPEDNFYKSKKAKDGLFSWCKFCSRESSRQYRKNNLDSCKEKDRRYRESNRDRYREHNKKNYWANREYHLNRRRQWEKENPDWRTEWLKNNRDKVSAWSAKRREHLVLPEDERIVSLEYRKAIERDPCFYCKRRADEVDKMVIDHIKPLSLGGTDHWWNLVNACESCNLRKGPRCITWMRLKI